MAEVSGEDVKGGGHNLNLIGAIWKSVGDQWQRHHIIDRAYMDIHYENVYKKLSSQDVVLLKGAGLTISSKCAGR